VFDFASVYGFHHRLSARKMPIERADADAGAARNVFQAHVQPDIRERRLRGVDQ
jgi:hypothetical protein